MGDFGQIIDPYRGAGPQGGLLDAIQQFAQFQQAKKDIEMRDQTYGQINQAQGFAPGTDPFATQKFGTQEITNKGASQQQGFDLAHETEAQNYVHGFMGSPFVAQSQDPYIAAQRAGGGRYGAEAISKFMGNEAQNTSNFAHEDKLQQARSAAALEQAKQMAGINTQAEKDQLTQKDAFGQESEKRTTAGINHFIETGDPSQLDPRILGSETAMIALSQKHKERLDAEQTAIKQARLRQSAESVGGGQPQQQVQSAVPVQTPEVPNEWFDPRVMTPRHEGDGPLQNQYDNAKNILGFIPKTLYYGGKDAGYKGAEKLDEWFKNFRF